MKEVLPLEPAAQKWARLWTNKKIYIPTDNHGMPKITVVMDSLCRVFWLSVKYNFRMHVVYYPGVYNVVADSISRMHESRALTRLHRMLKVA